MPQAGEGSRYAFGWIMLFVQLLAPAGMVAITYKRQALQLFPLNDNGGRTLWLYALAVVGSWGYLIVPISEIMGEDIDCDALLISYWQMPLTATPILLSALKYYYQCRFQAQIALQAGGGGDTDLKLDDLQGTQSQNRLVMQIYLGACFVAGTACIVASQSIDNYGEGKKGCQSTEWQEDGWFYMVGVCVWATFLWLAKKIGQLAQDGFGIHREIMYGAYSIFVLGVVWVMVVFIGWQSLGEGELYAEHFNPDYLQYITFLVGFSWLTLWPSYRTYHPDVERPPFCPGPGFQLPCLGGGSGASLTDSLGGHGGHGGGPRASALADGDAGNVQLNPMAKLAATLDPEADITLLNIISDPRGFNFFKSHLQTEFSVENIVYWGECADFAAKWEQQSASPDGVAAINQKAKWINSTFVIEGSKLEINISNAQRTAIETAIDALADDGTPAPKDVFAEGQQEIYKLMERDSLPRFRKSPLFTRYVEGEPVP